MGWILTVAAVVVIAAALYGLHRAALWAEARGWIYYRSENRKRPLPMGILDAIYQPAMEHVAIEAGEEAARGDQAESGQDPDGDD